MTPRRAARAAITAVLSAAALAMLVGASYWGAMSFLAPLHWALTLVLPDSRLPDVLRFKLALSLAIIMAFLLVGTTSLWRLDHHRDQRIIRA